MERLLQSRLKRDLDTNGGNGFAVEGAMLSMALLTRKP